MVKSIFAKAFLISTGIFIIGFFIGGAIERSLTADIEAKTTAVENSIQEIELESLYLLSISNKSCVFLNDIVRKTNNNLDDLAGQLANYDEDNIIFTNRDLVNLKSKYTNLLLKSWLIQENLEGKCGKNSVSILYFYDRDCNDCQVQGNILTSLKHDFQEGVMVFPLDHSLGLSSVDLLESSYNVTKFPSIVVNDVRYEGIINFESLKSYICSAIPQNEKCIKLS
jgi:hypothetical protein